LPADVKFQGKYAPKSISDNAPPQIPLEELTALPSWKKGPSSKGSGKVQEGKKETMGKGREREEKGTLCVSFIIS